MKKLLLIVLLFMGVGSFITALGANQVPMEIVKSGGIGGGNTKAPARPWYITQEDYALTLAATPEDYTLELVDESGVVVYSTFLSTGTTQVILPSTLSGDFELRLEPLFATYYYRGYIEL